MPLEILTENPKWDFPIYKVLANNDTGQASGNQGGMASCMPVRASQKPIFGIVLATHSIAF